MNFLYPKNRQVLLGALSKNPSNWTSEREKQRLKYNEIKLNHTFSLPGRLSASASEEDNPLSQNENSIWNQHFRDNELRNLIYQDVIRTNPSVEYYHRQNIQEIMANVLFCYAREFPKICYRQGLYLTILTIFFLKFLKIKSL